MNGNRIALLAVCLAAFTASGPARADEPQALPPEQFETLHRMLKPQPGESRWMEIDWYPNLWEARRKAAAEGKALFLWAGSGGAPAAGC